MAQGFNNLTGYQQTLFDTAPKPTVAPGFSPIKGVGGLAGASMMLLPEWNNFTKNLWRNMNLNTMDPAERDRMLKGYQQTMALFGKDKEGELAKKYPGYQYNSNNTEAPSNMPVVAKAVYNLLSGNKRKDTPQILSNNTQPSKQSTQQTANQLAGQVTGQAAPTVENQLREMLSVAPKSNGGSGERTDADKLQAINDYVARLQEVNKPYTEALNNYINNYNDLAKGNFNAQRYFTAMAGLAKNPGYIKLADTLNPLNNEANRINAMKMVRDAEAGNVNAINEMLGNLAMAEELGLPPEAAFANKNLLTAMSMQNRDNTKLEIALANNLIKKYGIDKNYARALAQQALRNQGSLAVANTYMSGGAGGVAPGLNAQGGVQTSYKSPINNQQSQEATLFQQVTGH